MTGWVHITIRRQVLDVELHGSEAEGLALQRRLPAVCTEVVSPTIESALVAFDPGDSYLSLDRLAIDLSLASVDGFEAELAAAVRREIAEHFRRHPLPSTPSEPAEAGVWPQERTPAQALDDALATFLRTGRLPWAFRLPPGRTLEQFVRDTWLELSGSPGPPPAAVGRLAAVLGARLARERLVLQFTPEFTLAVLHALSPELAAAVTRAEGAVLAEGVKGRSARSFVRGMRLEALEAAAAGGAPSPAALAAAAWAALTPDDRADVTLASTLESAWPGATRAPDRAAGTAAAASTGRAEPTTTDGAEPGGVLVDNAGLVLLHPFLTRFLEGLGVAAGDRLLDPDRALALLHHLATGELAAPEHRLTLAKVLLGVPSGQPNEADVGLTDTETAEATGLLEAAVGHWEALRGTSPEALRAEFLQRPGVLAETPDGDWLLRVEARTVDILLDQLPWGLSSFRLPWMDRLMMVEWR